MTRLLIALFLVACPALLRAETKSEPGAASVRLGVVISIDQCRADYLERFRPYFVEGGFRRLLEQGADFRAAYHKHAMTATAPGHATILTGVSAHRHGVIANEWFDPAYGRVMGGVEDPRSPVVGALNNKIRMPGVPDAEITGSPWRLQAATVGDQLKLRFGEASRVISIANKDRAAIFLGGRLADAAYWFVDGHVVTSTFYRKDLPGWVKELNAEEQIEKTRGQVWNRLLAPAVYDAVQGPDDAPGEEGSSGLGTTFPHTIDGGPSATPSAYYGAYRASPFWTELLGELAKRAIVKEKLGHHEAPDLLCIGFSQLDYAGHLFGPDSHEIMDSVIRLDRVLAELFATLDREVGPGRYVVVLSGDHGVAPLPEHVASFGRGVTSGRLDRKGMTAAIEMALTARFGAPADGAAWVLRDGYGYRLIGATLAAKKLAAPEVAAVVKESLLNWPQIAMAFTREELLDGTATQDPYLAAWRLSFNRERSPDVMFSARPYVVDRPVTGTNHGTPYDYDAHIPMVWYGAGITPRVSLERVGTDAIAPTLAKLLGVPRPPEARADPVF